MITKLRGSVRSYSTADGATLEQAVDLQDTAGLDQLLDLLSGPDADDAYVVHEGRPLRNDPLEDELVPDHVVYLAVRDDFGYFGYLGPVGGQDDVMKVWPVGHPDSPATHGTNNIDYPSGTGLALPQFREVVDEFRQTGELSRRVRWVSELDAETGEFDRVLGRG